MIPQRVVSRREQLVNSVLTHAGVLIETGVLRSERIPPYVLLNDQLGTASIADTPGFSADRTPQR